MSGIRFFVATPVASSVDSDDVLAAFYIEALRKPLMTHEEERARAARIADREAAAWRHILGSSSAEDVLLVVAGEVPEIEEEALRLAGLRSLDRRRGLTESALRFRYLDQDRSGLGKAVGWLEFIEDQRTLGKIRPLLLTASREKAAFAEANLRLVMSIARRYVSATGAKLDDLVQDGNIGLLKAIDRYDHRMGWRFATYASWWIRHAIVRAFENRGRDVRMPVHIHQSNSRVRRYVAAKRARLGREPTVEELVADGLNPLHVERAFGPQIETVSLETPCGSDGDLHLADYIADTAPSAEEECADTSAAAELRRMVAKLPPKERLVIERRFGIGRDDGGFDTLRGVGDQLGVSRERIRQVEAQTLRKLRRSLESDV